VQSSVRRRLRAEAPLPQEGPRPSENSGPHWLPCGRDGHARRPLVDAVANIKSTDGIGWDAELWTATIALVALVESGALDCYRPDPPVHGPPRRGDERLGVGVESTRRRVGILRVSFWRDVA
jgi:hypothetical protein